MEIYPESQPLFYTPRGRLFDGRADSTLIARYSYEQTR